eukprot:Skav222477  [mRNA]  locus=scaffold242:192000:195604:+ [translate_table: standard]
MTLQSKFVTPALEEMKGFELGDADGKEYAIALRMLGAPAGVEHVYRFTASAGETVEMCLGKGQSVDELKQPLVLERVQSIALQARSSFGAATGPQGRPDITKDTSRYCTRCGESRNAEEEREARAAAEEARKQNLKWECRPVSQVPAGRRTSQAPRSASNVELPDLERCFSRGASGRGHEAGSATVKPSCLDLPPSFVTEGPSCAKRQAPEVIQRSVSSAER